MYIDVSRYKYPPSWVPLEHMHNAINTIDSVSNDYRGFLIVSPDPVA
jgi:glutathione gamma-glutamylcysteinyltransferase